MNKGINCVDLIVHDRNRIRLEYIADAQAYKMREYMDKMVHNSAKEKILQGINRRGMV